MRYDEEKGFGFIKPDRGSEVRLGVPLNARAAASKAVSQAGTFNLAPSHAVLQISGHKTLVHEHMSMQEPALKCARARTKAARSG